MAGNGRRVLELLEQLDGFDTVVVAPDGGGGLLTGIASAVKAERPEVQFVVAEPETGAPVAATLAAGSPTAVEYTPSSSTAGGAAEPIPRVWEQASKLVDAAYALPLDEVAAAVRVIAEAKRGVIAEGCGGPFGRDSAASAVSGGVRRRSSASCRAATRPGFA